MAWFYQAFPHPVSWEAWKSIPLEDLRNSQRTQADPILFGLVPDVMDGEFFLRKAMTFCPEPCLFSLVHVGLFLG